MDDLSLVSPIITLALCHAAFDSVECIKKHIKHNSVWKFAIDFA